MSKHVHELAFGIVICFALADAAAAVGDPPGPVECGSWWARSPPVFDRAGRARQRAGSLAGIRIMAKNVLLMPASAAFSVIAALHPQRQASAFHENVREIAA